MGAEPLNLAVLAEVMAAQKAVTPAVKRLAKALASLDEKLPGLPQGAVADLLYDLRQIGSLCNTVTAPLKEVVDPAIKTTEEYLINTLEKGDASGLQGKVARVQVTTSAVPTVTDWDKLYKYIGKTKSFELLNRAVNRAAVQERWDLKKQVPGVGVFNVPKVSCTKLGGKR